MIKEYSDIYTYLEFIQTKLELYTKDVIDNDLRYKLFKEFIIKDINNNLDILYKEWCIDLLVGLSEPDKTNTKEDFVNDLEWLYNEIDKVKYNYLEEL